MKVFTNNCFKWKIFPAFLFAFLVTGFSYQANAQDGWRMVGEIDSHVNDWSSVMVKDHSGNIYASMGSGIYKFNGTKWTEVGEYGNGFGSYTHYRAIAVDAPGNNIYAAGDSSNGNFFIAKFNGTGWTILPLPVASTLGIGKLTTDNNGNLYASFAGGSIYKWNGTMWTNIFTLSGGATGVGDMLCNSAGKLYAVENYSNISGQISSVNVWDGVSWTVVGASSSQNIGFYSLLIDDQDNVYAAAYFFADIHHPGAVKWNGTAWIELGTGPASQIPEVILSIAMDAQHNIYGAGYLRNSSNKQIVVKWDGTSWSKLGTAGNDGVCTNTIDQLVVDNAGNICAAVNNHEVPQPNVTPDSYIAKWNGTNWHDELGGTNAALHSYANFGDVFTDKLNNVYVNVTRAWADVDIFSAPSEFYLGKWDGSAWTEATSNVLGLGRIRVDGNGYFYSAGSWVNANGKYYVGKWNGTAWIEPGAGTSALNANNISRAIVIDQQDNVYVAGSFTNSNSKTYVAKWDGNTWAELGSGATALNGDSTILSLTVDQQGNIYAAGYFTNTSGKKYVAKWNGTGWSELGTGTSALNANSYINTLTADNAGNIYAAGAFTNASGKLYVAKWNGSSWSELGAASNGFQASGTNAVIWAILADSTGNIYASGGRYRDGGATIYTISKWNGVTWSGVGVAKDAMEGIGAVLGVSMAIDTSGNLYAANFWDARKYGQVAKLAAPGIYTFTGNGSWSNASNWINNTIPPSILPTGAKIIINPANGGQCTLNTIQTISPGAIFIISAGAHFVVTGNLINNQ